MERPHHERSSSSSSTASDFTSKLSGGMWSFLRRKPAAEVINFSGKKPLPAIPLTKITQDNDVLLERILKMPITAQDSNDGSTTIKSSVSGTMAEVFGANGSDSDEESDEEFYLPSPPPRSRSNSLNNNSLLAIEPPKPIVAMSPSRETAKITFSNVALTTELSPATTSDSSSLLSTATTTSTTSTSSPTTKSSSPIPSTTSKNPYQETAESPPSNSPPAGDDSELPSTMTTLTSSTMTTTITAKERPVPLLTVTSSSFTSLLQNNRSMSSPDMQQLPTKTIDASCRQQTSPSIMQLSSSADGKKYEPYAVIQTSSKCIETTADALSSAPLSTEEEKTLTTSTGTVTQQSIPTDPPAIVNAFHAYAELMLKKQQSPVLISGDPSTSAMVSESTLPPFPISSLPTGDQEFLSQSTNPLKESNNSNSSIPNVLAMSGQVPVRRSGSPSMSLNLSADALQAPVSPASKSPNTSPLPSPTRVYAMAYDRTEVNLTESELETITEEKPFKYGKASIAQMSGGSLHSTTDSGSGNKLVLPSIKSNAYLESVSSYDGNEEVTAEEHLQQKGKDIDNADIKGVLLGSTSNESVKIPNSLGASTFFKSPSVMSSSLQSPEIDDWNARFQRCINGVRRSQGEQEKLKKSFRKLISLAQDFLHSAKTYGKIIIDEHEIPLENKTVKPMVGSGLIVGEKYLVANIIFKFALGGEFLNGFTDEVAVKVAGHELKGLLSYYNSGVKGLHVPLIALLDYRGYRLLAISRLPVSSDTLRYGTSDAAKTIHNELDPSHMNKLKRAAQKLNLKPHDCRTKAGDQIVHMYSPCDLEGHIGNDGRFYILDFSRTMPPVMPTKGVLCSHLYRLFRPEFVQQYPVPLCSDGFSGFIKGLPDADIHNREIVEATKFLQERVIPETASLIGFKVAEAIRFREHLHQFQIVRMIHAQGVNIRYLPLLRQYCKHTLAKGLLMIEMVARTLKQFLRKTTREEMKKLKVPLEAPYKELMLYYLNIIFGAPTDVKTEKFWKETLPAAIIEKFGIDGTIFLEGEIKENLRRYVSECLEGQINGLVLLSMKIVQMMKIKLGAMLSKMLQKHPDSFNLCEFVPLEEVDIRTMGIRVKHMNLVAHAEGYLLRLRGDNTRMSDESKKVILNSSLGKLEEALSTDPRNKYTLRNCAMVLSTMYRHSQTVQNVDPNSHEKSLLRKANNYFLEAIRVDPKDSFSCYHYAKFLFHTSKAGDPENEKKESEFLRMLRYVPSDLLVLGLYYKFLVEVFGPGREMAAKKVLERSNKVMEAVQKEKQKHKEAGST